MINEIAPVVSNYQIAQNYWQTVLYAPQICKSSLPGQFINILPVKNWQKMMRRPMSIASCDEGNISIIYKVIGEGTRHFSEWIEGDTIDIIGPLGNCWPDTRQRYPILIGGGVGIAPILFLQDRMVNENTEYHLIMGARTKNEHFLSHDPENKIFLTTDDGTRGIHGTVITALEKILHTPSEIRTYVIFACGPSLMLNSIKRYAADHSIDCYLALETIMACGFGICQGCSVERTNNKESAHSYRQKYSLVCMDGPVFKSDEILRC